MRDSVTSRERAVTLVVCIVQFITPFMMSAVGIALPAIGKTLSASAFELGLAEMVYILGVTLLLMPAGQLADIFGRRKVFLAGLAGFSITTTLLAASRSMEIFLVLRFLQGVTSALITTTSFAILSSVIPAARRGRSMGIVVAAVYAGLSAGPSIGGVVVAAFGWPALFGATAVVSTLALVLSLVRLTGEWVGASGQKFDLVGSLLYMVSVGTLVAGVTGRNLPFSGMLEATGLVGGLLFFFREWHTKSPILPIRMIVRNRILGITLLATYVNYAASFGIVFFFSLYLQVGKGMAPQTAGSLMMIQTVIQCLLSPVAGRLADRIPPSRIATVGMGLCAMGMTLATRVSMATPLIHLVAMFSLFGVGFALFSTPNMTAIVNAVPASAYGQASSLTATMRTLGMLSSMTLSTMMIARHMGHVTVNPATLPRFMEAFHAAMLLFVVISISGVFLSLGRLSPKTGPTSVDA